VYATVTIRVLIPAFVALGTALHYHYVRESTLVNETTQCWSKGRGCLFISFVILSACFAGGRFFCGRCVLFGVLKIHERLTFENILGYIFFRPKSNHEVRDLDVVL